ncbi:MAG: hypothetical protein ACP5IB_07590 [Thermoplasmata archaeon]
MYILLSTMITYGTRKVIAKQKGPRNDYYFVMLPTRYCKLYKVQKGEYFRIYSTKKGDLILRRGSND